MIHEGAFINRLAPSRTSGVWNPGTPANILKPFSPGEPSYSCNLWRHLGSVRAARHPGAQRPSGDIGLPFPPPVLAVSGPSLSPVLLSPLSACPDTQRSGLAFGPVQEGNQRTALGTGRAIIWGAQGPQLVSRAVLSEAVFSPKASPAGLFHRK